MMISQRRPHWCRLVPWREVGGAAVALLALGSPRLVFSATLGVPVPFATIGSALAAAQAGDTVLVQPGTYPENLTMKSGVILRGASTADPPIIDAGQLGVGITAALCDASTRLEDLVITHGLGSGFGGGIAISASPITIHRCRLAQNTSLHGGGVGADDSAFSLIECVFENNSATQSGGAVSVTDLPSPSITGCRFVGNSAVSGGAIAVRNGCQPSIVGCVVEANSAAQGGAIWFDFFSGGSVSSCTIVTGSSTGAPSGALFFSPLSNPSIVGNIVAFAALGSAVVVGGGAAPSFGCNDVFGNAGGDSIAGVIDLGTNFSADPLFCDSSGGDYTLQATSPCLNRPSCGTVGAFGAGSCAGVSVDVALETSSWGALKARYR